MPKFVGNHAPEGATRIQDNAAQCEGRLSLQYCQMRKLPPSAVVYSRDTTDRGGRKNLAKRWNRWFADPRAVLACESSTSRMRESAIALLRATSDRYVP